MRTLATKISLSLGLCTLAALVSAQWTSISTGPGFDASTPLLLQDGRVLVQQSNSPNWKILTPDANGSYVNGSWSSTIMMTGGHSPLYYASGVLNDGRVVVCGGEYNGGSTGVESNLCSVYNPATNSWSNFTGPGYSQIGDSMGLVLPNGTFMLGHFSSSNYSILNPATMTWTNYTGSTQGKADSNSEESWNMMPNGQLLCVDCSNGNAAEVYDIATNQWSLTGSTVNTLPFALPGYVAEIGPQIMMHNGTVFVMGAGGFTGIYNMNSGTWTDGPQIKIDGEFQGGFDSPGAIMPNGNALLVVAKAKDYNKPSHWVEFNGSTLTQVSDTSDNDRPAYRYRMLVLPTGEVMVTDETGTVKVYTAGSTVGSDSWRPVVDNCPANMFGGQSYTIGGRRLSGLTEGSYYGDDAGNSTNYPLVRIRNNSSGHVKYCRTHDVSSRQIVSAGDNGAMTCQVDIPGGIESGASTLEVVANGIPSYSVAITVNPDYPITDIHLAGTVGDNSWYVSNVAVSFTAFDGQGNYKETHYKLDGGADTVYSGAFLVTNDANPHTVEYWSVDTDGNTEPHKTANFKRDATDPTLTFDPQSPAANSFGWNNTNVSIHWTAADAMSGLATASSGTLNFTSEGANQTQSVTPKDNAGNDHLYTTVGVNIDKTKPSTTDSEPAADGCNGWYHGTVQVTLNASDSLSGVQYTKYRVDGGAAQTYSGAFNVGGDGIHSVEYWSVDKADNEESHHTISIKIDGTPPVITAAADKTEIWSPNHKMVPVTLSGKMTDNLSGVDPNTAQFWVVDEYGKVQPSGAITLNADGTYSFTIDLEASRLGQDKDGRTYTVYIKCLDFACNPTTVTVVITVPHDQRGGGN